MILPICRIFSHEKKKISVLILLALIAGLFIFRSVVSTKNGGGQQTVAEMAATQEKPAKTEKTIKYYWDPMLGPSSISDKPGISAMGMDLVPVYEDAEQSGPGVRIDPRVIQNMGIRSAAVIRGRLTKSIRAVGILALPEPGLYDVSLKINGWIERLYADKEGMFVKKDDPLFEIYSPELQVAEEEFIGASNAQGLDETSTSQAIQEAAKQKLKYWDVANQEIEALRKAGHAPRTTIFRSPATGHIEERLVVRGSSIQPGMKLLRIADHSTLWLEAQIYEEDIPVITLNQEMEASVDGIPGQVFKGPIIFIYPHLDQMTRTVKVRIAIPNQDFLMKPGMFATVSLKTKAQSDSLLIPRDAVIDTGEKQFVFVVKEDGHFEPMTVHTGMSGDESLVEIKDGLTEDELVVTSGQFLLDVESRTNEAIQKLRKVPTPSSSGERM